jgi:hypothetical protein
MVSGVTTTPVGVVGVQGDTGVRRRHDWQSSAPEKLCCPDSVSGVDHVDATLRTLALSMTMEWGPGPFCPTVDVGGRPAEVCRG